MSEHKPKSTVNSKNAAEGISLGVVVSRWNWEVTGKLLEGAKIAHQKHGGREDDMKIVHVPGSFELPLALDTMAESGEFDALVALGVVVRGETPHFDYVATEASRGIREVMLAHGIPIGFGLLTTDNLQQAKDRAGGTHGNKGHDALEVALEMVNVLDGFQSGPEH